MVFEARGGSIKPIGTINFISMAKPFRNRREKRVELLRLAGRRYVMQIHEQPSWSSHYTRSRTPRPQTIPLRRRVREPSKIGMPRILSHTNDILISQSALSDLDRTRVVILIIMDPIADLVNGGEFEYLRTGLLMLIIMTQQKGGTSPELASTQRELSQETDSASGVTSRGLIIWQA